MTSFANVTVANSVPANVVFTPSKIDQNGVALYYSSAAILDARPSLTLGVRQPSKTSANARVTGKIVVPIMDAVITTQKNGECIATFELVLPKLASQVERLNVQSLLKNYLADASVTAAVTTLESIY